LKQQQNSFNRSARRCSAGLSLFLLSFPALGQQAAGAADAAGLAESVQELRQQVQELRSAVVEMKSEAAQYRAQSEELRKELEIMRTRPSPGEAGKSAEEVSGSVRI